MIIRFPDVYERICLLFSMPKETAKLVLKSMEHEGIFSGSYAEIMALS